MLGDEERLNLEESIENFGSHEAINLVGYVVGQLNADTRAIEKRIKAAFPVMVDLNDD